MCTFRRPRYMFVISCKLAVFEVSDVTLQHPVACSRYRMFPVMCPLTCNTVPAQTFLRILNFLSKFFKRFHHMFRAIWPSSSVKFLVLGKLPCSFHLTWSQSCSPLYTPLYSSVMGRWSCATLCHWVAVGLACSAVLHVSGHNTGNI
jgi:hypothetical protein